MEKKDVWASGDAYEPYVGRWSRLVAHEFLNWLNVSRGGKWLDVGCGTGALSQTILALCDPNKIKGIDRSEGFVQYARKHVNDPRVEFEVGDAQAIAVEENSFDATVSGLVLNFVPAPDKMISQMKSAVHEGGVIAIYVWDYADKMEFLRYFWDAVIKLDPKAAPLDEGPRFPICDPIALHDLFQNAGLTEIETCAIDIETRFKNFDDYWNPFLGGQGPAPTYVMSLSTEQREKLRDYLQSNLPIAADGSIPLVARAWAVKGFK